MSSYSHEITAVVKQFLDQDDWNYSFDDDRGIFDFNLTLKCRLGKIKFIIIVGDAAFTLYVVSPFYVDTGDKNNLLRMAEFITRVNYGLKMGNFEMDFNDGEVRFHIYEDCDDIKLSDAVVKNAIYTSAIIMEKFGNGISEIIYTDNDPVEVIKKCDT